jgi:hypothetical protein
MELLQNIKSERVRQKRKQPYRRGVFNTLVDLVKGHALGEDFLRLLDNPEALPPHKEVATSRVRAKDPFEFSLFPLASREEYEVARAILTRIDNPYLRFAHAPEEILLSGPLHEANPRLRPEELRRYHFETLLRHERCKVDERDLTAQATILERATDGSD